MAYVAAAGTTAADGRGRNSPYTSGLLAYLEQPLEQCSGRCVRGFWRRRRGSSVRTSTASLLGEHYLSGASSAAPVRGLRGGSQRRDRGGAAAARELVLGVDPGWRPPSARSRPAGEWRAPCSGKGADGGSNLEGCRPVEPLHGARHSVHPAVQLVLVSQRWRFARASPSNVRTVSRSLTIRSICCQSGSSHPSFAWNSRA